MEFYGFQKCLEFLQAHSVKITKLVTDRHATIARFMLDNYQEINHRFDLWHIAKSMLVL